MTFKCLILLLFADTAHCSHLPSAFICLYEHLCLCSIFYIEWIFTHLSIARLLWQGSGVIFSSFSFLKPPINEEYSYLQSYQFADAILRACQEGPTALMVEDVVFNKANTPLWWRPCWPTQLVVPVALGFWHHPWPLPPRIESLCRAGGGQVSLARAH